MNKEYLIGLDVSTKCIGIAIFEDLIEEKKGRLLELTHVQPKIKPLPKNKLEILFKKNDIFQEFISKYKHLNITKIIIEEPLLNSNNIYTTSTLIKFNVMISKCVYDSFNIVADFISSYDARKYAFPELMQPRTHNKKGEKLKNLPNPVLFGGFDFSADKKHIIFEKVSNMEPLIIWQRNKYGLIKKECYDQSDAYCAVLGKMRMGGIWK